MYADERWEGGVQGEGGAATNPEPSSINRARWRISRFIQSEPVFAHCIKNANDSRKVRGPRARSLRPTKF